MSIFRKLQVVVPVTGSISSGETIRLPAMLHKKMMDRAILQARCRTRVSLKKVKWRTRLSSRRTADGKSELWLLDGSPLIEFDSPEILVRLILSAGADSVNFIWLSVDYRVYEKGTSCR